ncbi:hypothetical protein MASR2M64_09450 [Candidatus Cloacimonadota bacterium]
MKTKVTILLVMLIAVISSGYGEEWMGYNSQNYITCSDWESDYLWLGTVCGLVRFNTVTGEKIYYDRLTSPIPTSSIGSIKVDNQGIKWVGTSVGLCKFDGSTWTTWNIDNSGIPGNRVRDIAIDAYNSIWVVTDGGLGRLSNNVWTSWTMENSDLPNENLLCLEIDNNGNKWIGTSQGVVLYAANTWTQLSNDDVTCMVMRTNNDVWVGTGNYGLAKYDGSAWTYYNPSNSNIRDVTVECMDIDPNGNIWLSTEEGESSIRGGLIKFDGTIWTVWNTTNSDIPIDIVSEINATRGSSIFSGTLLYGLTEFAGNTWTTHNISNSGLIFAATNCVEFGNNNRKWFGSELGVSLLDNTGWSSWGIFTTQDPIYYVTHIVEDNNGTTWINSFNRLMSYDGSLWITHQASEFGLQTLNVSSLDFDSQGNLWIGTSEGLIKQHSGTFTVYNSTNSPLASNTTKVVKGLYSDYWVSTEENGLLLFNGNAWTSFNTTNSNIPSNNVTDFALDSFGNKWLATPNGLCKYDDATWTIWNSTNSDLPHNSVSSISIDSDNKIWLTSNLLDQWNHPNNGALTSYDGSNWLSWSSINSPLPEITINEVKMDSHGNKWIATNNGVFLYNEDSIVAISDVYNPVPSVDISVTNYPNPFNPTTTIDYNLPQKGLVKANIYNIRGQLVNTIVNEPLNSGSHKIIWSGLDDKDIKQASGVYFIRIECNGIHSVRKMLLMK